MSRQIALGAVVGFAVAVLLLAYGGSHNEPLPGQGPGAPAQHRIMNQVGTGRPAPVGTAVQRALLDAADGGP